MLRYLFALLVLGLGFYTPAAQAQTPLGCGVNYTPVVGINCANVRQQTYVGQILGLAPAASATDVWCLNASSSKTVTIRAVELSGTAATLITTPVILIRRNTVDTGGTHTAPNITAFNPGNSTATAVAVQYSANPTITDSSSHQTIRSAAVTLNVSGTTGAPADRLVWKFGTEMDAYDQGAVLTAGSTQQFCLNLGAVSVATGALSGDVEWTEQ